MGFGDGDELGDELLALLDVQPGLANEGVERAALLDGTIDGAVDVVIGDRVSVRLSHQRLYISRWVVAQISQSLRAKQYSINY